MAFNAGPVVSRTPEPSRYLVPAPWMRTGLSAAVALDTDVTLRVAGLAGLQISAGLPGMLTNCKAVFLAIGSQHLVGLDGECSLGETAVACRAELFSIMAAVTGTGVLLCLYRVELPEVRPVGLRHIVYAGV